MKEHPFSNIAMDLKLSTKLSIRDNSSFVKYLLRKEGPILSCHCLQIDIGSSSLNPDANLHIGVSDQSLSIQLYALRVLKRRA